jgi:GAF domain-containing protein
LLAALGVQAAFPRDTLLVEMGADSYMGLPLFSTTGELLGVMSVLHGRELSRPVIVEAILRGVVSRVGAELERERVQHQLQESERLLALTQRTGHVGSWELELPTLRMRWSEEMFLLH